MNPKNSKKSPIHENSDANITSDFGDGDISRSRTFLSNTYVIHTYIHTYIASSIIVRLTQIPAKEISTCVAKRIPTHLSNMFSAEHGRKMAE